jgi:amidophosphoribosyltransferase
MVDATGQSDERLCTACFTGTYPIPLPDEALLGKHLLEASLASEALPVLNNP